MVQRVKFMFCIFYHRGYKNNMESGGVQGVKIHFPRESNYTLPGGRGANRMEGGIRVTAQDSYTAGDREHWRR